MAFVVLMVLSMNKDELKDWIWEKFPLCGCGEPELVLIRFRDVLQIIYTRKALEGLDHESGDVWLWFYLLDKLDLIEHGSNVFFGWLTTLGRQILWCLYEYGCDIDKWEESCTTLVESGQKPRNLQ